MTEHTPNRREAPRKATQAPAKITLRNGTVIAGHLTDMSLTGGRFRAAEIPDIARWSVVTVEAGKHSTKARVIWQHRSRDGTSELGLESIDEPEA